MSPVTLAILRRPDRLVVLVSQRPEAVAAPKYDAPLSVDPYFEQIEITSAVRDLSSDYLLEISQAWERLGRVSEFDPQSIEDIATTLKTTTPDEVEPSVSPWRVPAERKVPQPTAAHPRAYRGTKTQPPAPATPPVIDLRPHLCNARDTSEIVRYLADRLPDDVAPALDAFAYPQSFRRAFGLLPLFAPEKVRQTLGLYWDLQLNDDEPLRRCVARLLREPWDDSPFQWCEAIKSLPAHRRTAVVEAVLKNNQRAGASAEVTAALHRMSAISDDGQFRNRLWAFMQTLRYHLPFEGLLVGFDLANAYRHEYDFIDKPFDGACQAESIIDWIEHICLDESGGGVHLASMALEVWSACGTLPGLSGLFDRRPWVGLEPDAACASIEILMDCLQSDTPEGTQQSFRTLLELADDYFDQLKRLPARYQCKGAQILRQVGWSWEGASLSDALGKAIALLPIVCRPPLTTECAPRVYAAMVELDQASFDEWISNEPSCFQAFDRACESENDAKLIGRGLKTLAMDESVWLVTALRRCPTVILRAGKTLGCMSEMQRVETIVQWRRHPLRTCDEDADLEDLAREIDRCLPPDVIDPLPRKVRLLARDEWELTENQKQRARQVVLDNLFDTRTDLLRRVALDNMARRVGEPADFCEDAAIRHAIHMLNLSEENRRGLKKFLRAYLAGRHDYVETHPANQHWLASHPNVDPDRWRGGMTMQKELADESVLVFSIETNPMEALRLGTYVRSCLGIGGMLAASAAAVVLDVNKAVVYARGERGQVVARQLLAISEGDELVCFSIYPAGALAEVQQCFVEFDSASADHLEIDLHADEPGDGEPKITNPVSKYWWDDGAWDREIESCDDENSADRE